MRQHMASAMQIAQYLEKHAHVQRVIYPPLESHAQHELYKKQMTGFSGMISVYLKGDDAEKSKRFLGQLKVIQCRLLSRSSNDLLLAVVIYDC
jgi:cystathionine beta-lyase/cystathionine gamma-synthase